MKIFFFIVFAIINARVLVFAESDKKLNPEQREHVSGWLQNQPVQFLENRGQMADMEGKPVPFVLFKASASGMDMYITEKGLTYVFIKSEEEQEEAVLADEVREKAEENHTIEWNRVDMELKGATIRKENIVREAPSVTDFNYFYAHCREGIYGVKKYEKITVKNIYPNIDWVLYNSTDKGFKYDFIVHPGADPAQIKLQYRSEKQLELKEEGAILIETSLGTLIESAPVSYLQESGASVVSRFTKKVIDEYNTEVAFHLSEYAANKTLVIDPQLAWGTFIGGNDFTGAVSVDCDRNGNIYVAGYTESATNFPLQAWGAAYFNGVYVGGCDVFIMQFSKSGVLTWGTYYGGSGYDWGNSITIDAADNIYVTGFTWSANFPTQNWAGAYNDAVLGGTADIFILRFSNTGVRTWATYYGGSGQEYGYYGYSVQTDVAGNIYVAGYTPSTDFPTQNWAGAYNDPTLGGPQDAYILRFSNAGVRTWATYYGGSGIDIAQSIDIDAVGNIYVTGYTESGDFPIQAWAGAYNDAALGGTADMFILRFSNAGARVWATFYGGTNRDISNSIAADALGNIALIGHTKSSDFPTQTWGAAYFDGLLGGTSDACILRFSNTGNRDWATYYGGSSDEDDYAWELFKTLDNIAIDTCGNMYFAFGTRSADVQTLDPGCGSYYDGIYGGPTGAFVGDIFLVEFNKTGLLVWGTYIGGSQRDFRNALALDTDNNLYITGEWSGYSTGIGLPVMNPGGGAHFDTISNAAGPDDSFIMKFSRIKPTQAQINPVCTCNGSVTVAVTCATAPVNYVWSNGSSTLNTTNLTNTISNLCPGNYSVVVTDAGCNRDTLFYTLTGSGNLTFSSTQTNVSCNGGNNGNATVSNLVGGTSPYTYVWNPVVGQSTASASGLIAGNYTVIVSDASGCSTSHTITITEPPALTSSQSISICTGQTHTLPGGTVVGISGVYKDTLVGVNGCDSIITTTLTVNPASISSQSISICSGNTHTLPGGTVVSTAGIYKDTLTSANGCDSIINTTLTVNPVSAASRSGSICAGQTYTLPGGTVVSAGGVYKDTLTSANGCDSIITTTLTVNLSPTVTISPNVTITQGSAITLTASGGGSYQWSTIETTQNINVSPVQTTTYCVTITDASGCKATACVTVTIEPIDCSKAGELYLPNAFSPNGDGENDDFCLPAGQAGLLGGIEYCIKELTINIFDRWGEKVYASDEKNFCWDGRYKDNMQNTSVFVYYFEATLINGEQILKSGNITLVR